MRRGVPIGFDQDLSIGKTCIPRPSRSQASRPTDLVHRACPLERDDQEHQVDKGQSL